MRLVPSAPTFRARAAARVLVDAVVVASVEGATTNSGTEIKMDNKEYLILREEEALGILEGKAATARGKK